MVQLKKPIHRTSTARRREQGKDRDIVSSLLPPAYIALRLAGTQLTYLLDIEVAYGLAVRQFMSDVERLAKRIKSDEGIRFNSARKKAGRQIRAEVRDVLNAAKLAGRRAK